MRTCTNTCTSRHLRGPSARALQVAMEAEQAVADAAREAEAERRVELQRELARKQVGPRARL